MIDYLALAIGHGLLAIALLRLVIRSGLDEDPLIAAIRKEGEDERKAKSSTGRSAARRARETEGEVPPRSSSEAVAQEKTRSSNDAVAHNDAAPGHS
jgi:hypothetical protein